ncbi:MAG: leucyl aminopeptidase family protein [Phycisphaeraceae bacterium]|nr:leucyl aminopeptidase family protein [Phycisphaeraceae bacterium]
MFQSIKVADRGSAEVLVVGVFQKAELDKQTRDLDTDASIAAAARRGECTGDLGRIAEAFPAKARGGTARVIIVGLGSRDSFKVGDLRAAAAAVGRRLAAVKEGKVRVDLSGPLKAVRADLGAAGRCFGEGMGLLGWVCDEFKGTGSNGGKGPDRVAVVLSSPSAAFSSGMEQGLALARSVNIARTLSETPPNIATPRFIAAKAKQIAKATGMSCRVIEGKELEKERLTGLINVGKASENKPCMIRLEYKPARGSSRGGKSVVLVGKTMTYDTGGLSLKINNSMVGMKRDKDGGCAVLGAMHAIATVVKPRTRVVALLSVAENSISDEAYRPDDIIRYRNGVTVEVTNTDAEGRLVLADALCWACENEDPSCIVDLATLTGGVVVALGSTFAGMFCEDDKLRRRLEDAMETSGERWWRLPMDKEYRDMMKSPVADVVNSNPNRKAHPIQGAAFLSYFVSEGVPWAHIDIAGVHAVEGDSGPFVKGPTGWGVRLVSEFVARG